MQWRTILRHDFRDLHHHVVYTAEHEHFVSSANVGPHYWERFSLDR
jgi:hypothetical protein